MADHVADLYFSISCVFFQCLLKLTTLPDMFNPLTVFTTEVHMSCHVVATVISVEAFSLRALSACLLRRHLLDTIFKDQSSLREA